MRKNRKRSKRMSVVAANSVRFGGIIFFFFVMVMMNIFVSSDCTQQMKKKGSLENELSKLEETYQRESTRWDEMKTPERISAALTKHGLAMRLPSPSQNVHMRANGEPYPGQWSLAKAKQTEFGAAKPARYRAGKSRR